MISLWANLTEHDVEAYAATVLLPPYLLHLHLAPFSFAAQTMNRDGREPLVLTYQGQGRVEEVRLEPEQHALGLIRLVCPRIDPSQVQLPQDDARWHWRSAAEPVSSMRVYFAPQARAIADGGCRPAAADSYVSVTRGHVFVGRTTVEAYWKAWLEHLRVDLAGASAMLATPAAGIDLAAGPLGGQLFFDDDGAMLDLVRFAGLEVVLAQLADTVAMDLHAPDACAIYQEGVALRLTPQ